MEQRGGKIAPHLLSQAELAHRLVEKVGHIHQIDEEVEMIPVAPPGQLVHRGEDLERVDQRQIPIQLAALPVHNTDVVGVLSPVLVRHEPVDPQ